MSQALQNNGLPKINLRETSTFLQIFDLGDRVDYRCFDDDKKRNFGGKNYTFGKLNRRELFLLEQKNLAGFGVFWIPNYGGQNKQSITRVRAVYVDYDDDDKHVYKDGETRGLPGFLARLAHMPPPHAIVESSPGKRHVYWKVEGVPVDQFSNIQKALAEKLKTDVSIHDPSRVMRLPGFLHQKPPKTGGAITPFMSCVIGGDRNRSAYTLAEVRAMSGVDNVVPLPAKSLSRGGTAAPIQTTPENARDRSCALREEEHDRACVLSALNYLADNGQAESHDTWQAVGACLRGTTRPTGAKPALLSDDEALHLFDQFSERASNYDPDGVPARWDTLGDAISGIGALLARAQSLGWKQPERPKPARRNVIRPDTGRGSTVKASATTDGEEAEDAWLDMLDLTSKGEIHSTLDNACALVSNAADMRGVFAFDQMARDVVTLRPFGESTTPYRRGRRLDDSAISEVIRRLNRHGMRKVSSETAYRAVVAVAEQNATNPLKDYLRGLQWDGVLRADQWLTTYLGAPDTPYTRAIGRMWMVGAVARAMRPGCKNDYMLVLQGLQGAGKSAVLRALGGDWFSDQLPDVKNRKEAAQHLRGVWIAEIAEMSATRKADAEALKHFITTTTERYRPPYGRVEVEEPRTCVLVGTTNEETFLRDTTGNRRFWPVTTGTVQLEAITRDRNQLWAEAVAAFGQGERHYPDKDFEREHITPEQAAREDVDPWEDVLADAIKQERSACERNKEPLHITLQTLTEKYLRIERGRASANDGRRVAAIMRRLGMEQARRNKGRERFYKPSE